MKNTLLTIIGFLASMLPTRAQILYGTTVTGGNYGGGTINKLVAGTNTLSVTKSFEPAFGFGTNPWGNVIQATDGKLYGLTEEGGDNNDGTGGIQGYGVIFSFDPASSTYTKLRDLDYSDGVYPTGSLVQAIDGKLYGMAPSGGSGYGTIFSFDPVSSTFTKLMDFGGNNGANPYGSLIQASDGKFYGMTTYGGTSGNGVIFSFDPSSATYTKLKDLVSTTDGGNPIADLFQASDGMLYGMASAGGSSNAGVIFSFDLISSTYTKLKDFDGASGSTPNGSLMQSGDGKLYGMASQGGSHNNGVIFSIDPASSTYTKLIDLDNNTKGGSPRGSLMQASDGKLYGLAGGGSLGHGVIFSFDSPTSTYTNLKNFDFTNGGTPFGSLMQATNGKLYGLTEEGGGRPNYGVIFSFDPSSSTYTKLKDFSANEDGSSILGSLMQATDGKLYGTASLGGSNTVGVIFSFDPSSSTYSKIKDLDGANGDQPTGSLVQATDGLLYGTTTYGGSHNSGVIFSFNPATSIYIKVWDFDSISGASLFGNSLIQATDGKLYGMARAGGSTGDGVIFSFDPASSTYTKLKDFDGISGSFPTGNSLVQASNGKLYGMTTSGGTNGFGAGDGVIFSFDPSTSIYTKIKDFDGFSGAHPYGSLIQASDGNLYGTTFEGGSGYGVLFSLDLLSSTYTILWYFDNINGGRPQGNTLKQASDGKLYGMTSVGGSSSVGAIFSFDLPSSTYTKLQDFDGTNGENPYYGSTLVEISGGTLPVTLVSFTGKNNGSSNQLSWKVGLEQNLNYYELQRSSDGQNFKPVSQIKASGNEIYTYNDAISTTSSVYYYRLKSVDKDGRSIYSAVVKITTSLKDFVVVNPNPFKDKLIVNIELPVQDKTTLIITDMNGKQLYKQSRLLPAGTSAIEINETGRLARGTYLLSIISWQLTQSIKVVKAD